MKNELQISGYMNIFHHLCHWKFSFCVHFLSLVISFCCDELSWQKKKAVTKTCTHKSLRKVENWGITCCNENLSHWPKNKHKTQKTAIKIYYTKISPLLVARERHDFFCGNKVKDEAKMLSERQNWENYLFQTMKHDDQGEGRKSSRLCANNFNENGIVLWAHRNSITL